MRFWPLTPSTKAWPRPLSAALAGSEPDGVFVQLTLTFRLSGSVGSHGQYGLSASALPVKCQVSPRDGCLLFIARPIVEEAFEHIATTAYEWEIIRLHHASFVVDRVLSVRTAIVGIGCA